MWSTSLLSTPTADTPGTTIVLNFNDQRYLFGNIGEGAQRSCVQRKVGLTKMTNIFLTGTINWGTTGGILGMILTCADSMASSQKEKKLDKQKKSKEPVELEEKLWLNIHGGKNLTHLLATARRFVFRKGMPILTNELLAEDEVKRTDWEPTWKDDYIKVWSMVVTSGNKAKSQRKRSSDEISDDVAVADGSSEPSPAEQKRRDQELRRAVVSSMFDSEWRMDALITRKLKEVRMPAKIFVRVDGKMQEYTGPMPGGEEELPDIDVLVRNPWPAAEIEELPSTTPSRTAISYIVKSFPRRGKFNPQLAKSLGVKPGPDFARLTNGESITTANGDVVTSEQVIGETIPGIGIAVVELPDESFVEALIARKEWASEEVISGVRAIYWILGPGVVGNEKLLDFMRERSSIKHIVSSTDCCSNYLAFESPAAAAINLHLIDSERFPVPSHTIELPSQKASIGGSLPYKSARIGQTIQLVPKFEVQDNCVVPYLDTSKVVEDASQEIIDLANKARAEVSCPEYQAKLDKLQEDLPSKDAEVIALGTGSALPSKYRNVSATLLRVPGYGNYLFDCGENTLGQLKRVFGGEFPSVIRDLKVIWISHLHADHHLGTASVIKAWNEETLSDKATEKRTLAVASDDRMIDWLQEYSDIEDFGLSRLETIRMTGRANGLYEEFTPEDTQKFGLTSISAVRVVHCNGALAVVMNFPNGFKVAYSGDCRPNVEFARVGKGATLLIHEATFDDELRTDALAKKHCTTSEALAIGKQMGARRILLTHFSQRYQKLPVMNETEEQVAVCAFDYMRVKIEDFSKVAAFRPALLRLYDGVNE